jgi:maltokinase
VADLTVEALASLLAATEPVQLLPVGHETSSISGPLTLVHAAPLGGGVWLTAIRSSTGSLFGAPVVGEGGRLRRARPGDGAAVRLLGALAQRPGGWPEEFEIYPVLETITSVEALPPSERPMLVDQTHESVVVADEVVVKWSVAAEPTPAPVLVAHLSQAGFTRMARPWGFVQLRSGGQSVLLASAVQFLKGAEDGWTWAVGEAGAFATGGSSLAQATSATGEVGQLVADLHLSMTIPSRVISRPTVMAGAADVVGWQAFAESLLDEAVDGVDGAEGERLRTREPRMRSVLGQLSSVPQSLTIPVHGDLHVGQVLRWAGGLAVGDFDGNPVLPVSERLAPQPPARDVAGMLQSIDHVGRVVNHRVAAADAAKVSMWIGRAQTEFLDSYLATLASAGREELFDERLLLPLQVEQECREFLYAVRHLPRWRYVPDQALEALFP